MQVLFLGFHHHRVTFLLCFCVDGAAGYKKIVFVLLFYYIRRFIYVFLCFRQLYLQNRLFYSSSVYKDLNKIKNNILRL